jgi:hypothetical protein
MDNQPYKWHRLFLGQIILTGGYRTYQTYDSVYFPQKLEQGLYQFL